MTQTRFHRRGRRGHGPRLCEFVTTLELTRVELETHPNALRFTCRSRATVAVGRKYLCALHARQA